MGCCGKNDKGKDTKKGACSTGPRIDNDQLGENSSGMGRGPKTPGSKKS